ncbi:hypothetical protein NDU88_001947 [Pleurodeles waltl]|uniref:Uncharacterized protein n=1 Tax=Pleurodeles waltl TaxID=8319 RepID=A0AAV7W326_PLEWA|nr:hypothetical protein NDU88_001947 [Pleurodeles waltl]
MRDGVFLAPPLRGGVSLEGSLGLPSRSTPSLTLLRDRPRSPDPRRARGRPRVPFSGHLRIAPLHLRLGTAQSRLRFSLEGLPGFRPPALGNNRPGPLHQFGPVALARQRLPAPPEAPAYRGGEGRRSTSESAGRIRTPARPGSRTGTRMHPGPVPSSTVTSRH